MRVAAAGLAAVLALLAGCGSSTKHAPPPQGPPTLRHPAVEVDSALAAEEMRAGYREDPGQDVWLARWLGLSPTMAAEWSPPFEGLTRYWCKPS